MIESILDTDLYKFSTSYAYFTLYPRAEGTFEFKDRNKENWLNKPEFLNEIKVEFDKLKNIRLTEKEMEWCVKNISYIPSNYWEWLLSFRFEPEKIIFKLSKSGVFECTVTDKLYKATFYEIAVLAVYSEVRNRVLYGNLKTEIGLKNEVLKLLKPKIKKAAESGMRFSEFGTRRRFSSEVQHVVVEELVSKKPVGFLGTSNVMLAMRHGLKPMGTFPHEWIMFHGAVFGYKRANYLGLEDWINVYDGELGIALVDTYTTKSFLQTLTKKQALLLSGFRQDSGDEEEVTKMIASRLMELGIDPKTKGLVYSNALDFDQAVSLHNRFKDTMNISFGIGTNLTSDVEMDGYRPTPANIVMKLSRCRMSGKDKWEDCLKLSDDKGKFTGSEIEREIAEYELGI